MTIRRRVYEIIEVADRHDKLSRLYDIVMILAVIANLIPLAFKGTFFMFDAMVNITGVLFVVDYILRLWTADYKLNLGAKSFMRYPFTPAAIIDLISILPSFSITYKLFRNLRLLRLFRVLRIFKLFRYSRSMTIVKNVAKNQKQPIMAVCSLAGAYVLISAFVIFNVEPSTFDTFFDAVYWAVISLTTVGYGDLYPVTTIGRTVAMISSVFGIAVVALPAGIITAGYMDELDRIHREETAQRRAEKLAQRRAERKAAEAAAAADAAAFDAMFPPDAGNDIIIDL